MKDSPYQLQVLSNIYVVLKDCMMNMIVFNMNDYIRKKKKKCFEEERREEFLKYNSGKLWG